MNKLLIIAVPVEEMGKNGKPSFSRDTYNIYSFFQSVDWSGFISENKENYCYITIKALRILARLEKAGKIGLISKNFRLDDSFSNNYGINGEKSIICQINGFSAASKEDDRNGIDGYYYGIPVQIKFFGHGISEHIHILDTGLKKNGISVVNASLATFTNFFEE